MRTEGVEEVEQSGQKEAAILNPRVVDVRPRPDFDKIVEIHLMVNPKRIIALTALQPPPRGGGVSTQKLKLNLKQQDHLEDKERKEEKKKMTRLFGVSGVWCFGPIAYVPHTEKSTNKESQPFGQ